MVAPQRGGVRQEEVRDEHRLRAAQVRVGRHQRRRRPARPGRRTPPPARTTACCSSGMRRRRYSRRSSETCSLRERPVCRRRPASPMRSTSCRSTKLCTSSSGPATQAGLRRPSSRIACERGDDRARVLGRQHAGGAERLGPRDAAGHVVFEERAIEAERDAEVERGGIGSGVEAAGPERHARFTSFCVGDRSTVQLPFSSRQTHDAGSARPALRAPHAEPRQLAHRTRPCARCACSRRDRRRADRR